MMEMHGVSAMMVTWIVLLHRQGKARQSQLLPLFVDVHGEQAGSELNSPSWCPASAQVRRIRKTSSFGVCRTWQLLLPLYNPQWCWRSNADRSSHHDIITHALLLIGLRGGGGGALAWRERFHARTYADERKKEKSRKILRSPRSTKRNRIHLVVVAHTTQAHQC